MKKILIIVTLFISFSCKSQIKNTKDTLGLVSRYKADALITKIDSTTNPKLIFSILDREYYIVIKHKCEYKEYYVETDSVGTIKRKFVINSNKEDKKILSKAFDFNQYSTGFINEVPNASIIAGKPSYFVIKDEKGKRYGEFSLSSMTFPSVIDKNTIIYLNKKITEYLKN